MALYEYQCDKCGHVETVSRPMGRAPKSVVCAKCPTGVAFRVFTAPALVTDTNNPLAKWGRSLGADTSTRAAAKRTFDARGLVMGTDRECEDNARSTRAEARRLDKVVADTAREYARLPDRLKKADAAKVAAASEKKAQAVTAAPMK